MSLGEALAAEDFSELPLDASGNAICVAEDSDTYNAYLDWLTDYLYRPEMIAAGAAKLGREQAWLAVSSISASIAIYLWQHPAATYPPARYRGIRRPIHADFVHRAELAAILSRVPRRKDRRELLNRFYEQLAADVEKGR